MSFSIYNKSLHPDMYNQIPPKEQMKTYTWQKVAEMLDIPEIAFRAWINQDLIPKPFKIGSDMVYYADQVDEIAKFAKKCEKI